MGNKISLEEELVNLKITSKQMQRAAKKCEKNEKAAVNKLKKVSRSINILPHDVCHRVVRVRFSAKRNRRIRDIMAYYYGSPNIFSFYPTATLYLTGNCTREFRRCKNLCTRCNTRKKSGECV